MAGFFIWGLSRAQLGRVYEIEMPEKLENYSPDLNLPLDKRVVRESTDQPKTIFVVDKIFRVVVDNESVCHHLDFYRDARHFSVAYGIVAAIGTTCLSGYLLKHGRSLITIGALVGSVAAMILGIGRYIQASRLENDFRRFLHQLPQNFARERKALYQTGLTGATTRSNCFHPEEVKILYRNHFLRVVGELLDQSPDNPSEKNQWISSLLNARPHPIENYDTIFTKDDRNVFTQIRDDFLKLKSFVNTSEDARARYRGVLSEKVNQVSGAIAKRLEITVLNLGLTSKLRQLFEERRQKLAKLSDDEEKVKLSQTCLATENRYRKYRTIALRAVIQPEELPEPKSLQDAFETASNGVAIYYPTWRAFLWAAWEAVNEGKPYQHEIKFDEIFVDIPVPDIGTFQLPPIEDFYSRAEALAPKEGIEREEYLQFVRGLKDVK